ncbi:MAG: response regulator [Burkholderiales bacterium]|nr:response regulator [Burkholderiales bacterium]
MEASVSPPPPTRTVASHSNPSLKKSLLWITVIWTAIVVAGATWAVHDQIDDHRQFLLQTTAHRLGSLSNSLEVTLQQLQALPRALSRQTALHTFLQTTHVEGSDKLTDANRLKIQATLMRNSDVRDMSRVLRDTAQDFALNDIFLMDRFGTVLADSRLDQSVNVLGTNFKTRTYFTEALDGGSGSQFAVGRITKIPGFYFAATVHEGSQLLGLVGIKQEPSAFNRFFDDPQRHLLVTDNQGVILMSAQGKDLLKRTPLVGHMTLDAAQAQRLYMQTITTLPWSLTQVRVRDQTVTQVTIEGQRHLVVSRPLSYGGLTAWAVVALDGENTLLAEGVLAAVLALVLGYWFIAAMAQRIGRLDEMTRAKLALQEMAHALPLVVFCYQQPAQGPGRFTFVGQGLKNVLGIDADALTDDPDLAWRLAHQDTLSPPTRAIEFPITRHQEQRWVHCNSTPSQQADGSITYNGYWLDITERKRLADRADAVFTHAPIAFLFYERDKGIYRCNPGALRLFRADNEQALLGLHLAKQPLSPKLQADGRPSEEAAKSIIQSLMTGTHQSLPIEWRHVRLDGDVFDAEIVVVPFDQEGRPHYCAIIQDITARKLTETAMREARAAAEASTLAKSHFLANMSHEIRTPMNAVMGMTHLALLEELPPSARNYVDKAHRAAGNLLRILNDVLDVSRIESGKLALDSTDFRLDDVFDNLADVLRMRAQEQGLNLRFEPSADIPTPLIGDPTRLGQVLINLGANALKFTERGGNVVIGAEVRRLESAGVEVHFWVRDTGIGMPPEVIAHLFDPFTQGDNSTTRQYGGTGLGLSISRQLVDMMNGQIWVQSALGQGSTFHFTAHFGLRELAPTPAPSQALSSTADQARDILQTARAQLAGTRLLLVEDQPLNQELACELLRRAGIEVVAVANGQQALDQLTQDGPFDGVLMDCQMPVMDGYVATERIRANPAWTDLPVIAMTASAMAADHERAADSGMNDHITKPLDLRQMFDTIARWVVPAPPPILDSADGLARCMGDLDLYRRLLKGFQEDQQDFERQFTQALREGDLARAIRHAHTLKGLASNIGARALQHAAQQLQSLTEQGPDNAMQPALDQTLAALNAVQEAIGAMVPPAPIEGSVAAAPDLNNDTLQARWQHLATLIRDNDAQALDVIREMVAHQPALQQQAAVTALTAALARYDFDAAGAALTSLRPSA